MASRASVRESCSISRGGRFVSNPDPQGSGEFEWRGQLFSRELISILSGCDPEPVTRKQADEIAGEYLSRERLVTDDLDRFESDRRALVRSLEALLPDLGDHRAIVDVHSLTGDTGADEGLLLLALGDEQVLWVCNISRVGDDGSRLQVLVSRFGKPQWEMQHVADCPYRDSAGAQRVVRAWTVEFGGTKYTFTTDSIVVHEPDPSREELLGRALAQTYDWDVGDLSADADS